MESFEEVHGRWSQSKNCMEDGEMSGVPRYLLALIWCVPFSHSVTAFDTLFSLSTQRAGQSKVVGKLRSTDINRLCSPSLLVTDPRSRYTADGFGKLLAGSPTRLSSGVSYPVVATTPTAASIHPPITRRACVCLCAGPRTRIGGRHSWPASVRPSPSAPHPRIYTSSYAAAAMVLAKRPPTHP